MKIDGPEHYFRAGTERMRQAWVLYREEGGESFSLAMYAAGVAVECMLRAFKMLHDPTFDEKHDLLKLFKASRMFSIDPDRLRAKGVSDHEADEHFLRTQRAVSEVYVLWSNDYRYASEDRLRVWLKLNRLDRGVRGDFLKERARQLLSASQVLLDRGVVQWNWLKK